MTESPGRTERLLTPCVFLIAVLESSFTWTVAPEASLTYTVSPSTRVTVPAVIPLAAAPSPGAAPVPAAVRLELERAAAVPEVELVDPVPVACAFSSRTPA